MAENNNVIVMPPITVRIVLSDEQADGQLVELLNRLSEATNKCSIASGGWDNDPSDGEKIASLHSKISTIWECVRRQDPKDEKMPTFTRVESEMADLVLKLMDYAQQRRLRLGEAVIARHRLNLNRANKKQEK